jgi:hypothetical protein
VKTVHNTNREWISVELLDKSDSITLLETEILKTNRNTVNQIQNGTTRDLQNSKKEENDDHVTDFFVNIRINGSAESRISF